MNLLRDYPGLSKRAADAMEALFLGKAVSSKSEEARELGKMGLAYTPYRSRTLSLTLQGMKYKYGAQQ